MIQSLATIYRRRAAFLLFFIFDMSFMLSPLTDARAAGRWHSTVRYGGYAGSGRSVPVTSAPAVAPHAPAAAPQAPLHKDIGGPAQPEMSSFKSIGINNMVNLFTGDFSYNIPLLDVGGYPVNIFYSGEVSVEQEASWVGLGWNINPGNVNRNMRGIPDDFNGDEKLEQVQTMKPNRTWGVSTSGDVEGIGLKSLSLGLGANLGFSINNYLGAAADFGVKGGIEFKVADKAKYEKEGAIVPSVKLGVAANSNSRDGFTVSPSVSLNARSFMNDRMFTAGIGMSTSINSKTGIKALQINEQVSANKQTTKYTFDTKCSIKTTTYSSTNSFNIFSSAITFARPSYVPAMRMPMSNEAIAGHFQLGGGIFGAYGSGEIEVYKQESTIQKTKQSKPMVGYLYYENAMNNPDAVMDFTRFNDREVTPHTPIISAPQYTYDVFTVQGEGTGGSIRAYRNDLGFVRDNTVGSSSKNSSFGVDVGPPGHYGGNFNQINTPSTAGEWKAGNKLHTPLRFKEGATGSSWENVLFRNPGEASVLAADQFNRVGGIDLVRFKLGGEAHNPTLEPLLDRFSKSGDLIGTINPVTTAPPVARQKRTQVIDFLKASDAAVIGLDKKIRNYDGQTILDNTNNLKFTNIERVDAPGGIRKANHISQINVTEANGKRYIYGIPVYNKTQKDFIFTVTQTDLNSPDAADKVNYANGENNPLTNPSVGGEKGTRDGYAETSVTPGYAHSFLLSGLLSPDYVDLKGDGITDDDLGEAVKFNYSRISDASGNVVYHKWRTPIDVNKANYNPGKRTDEKDDKGIISYGERESWYLHSIESKTMIAVFMLENRDDGKGVNGEDGGINGSDNSLQRLKEIRLYSKADLKANGWTNARPIKTVHFTYSYTLCPGTPDNSSGGGKLTLDGIYFTYNKQDDRANKNKYIFSYVNKDGTGNPAYSFNANDRWGSYKKDDLNPAGLKNKDFPYTPQEGQTSTSPKATLDQNAGAWALKTIVLPSGGQIEVEYESDDYAYVQNRRATDLMPVAGFGTTATAMTNRLYNASALGEPENDYLFIKVPEAVAGTQEVMDKYLQGLYEDQVAVKLAVTMPSGHTEYLTAYVNYDSYGKYDDHTIWIHMKRVNSIGPLSLTAVEFLREQLPGQAFDTYDLSGQNDLAAVGKALLQAFVKLFDGLEDPLKVLRGEGKAQYVDLTKCFVRLNDPDGFKYGGGQRVKTIRLKDNWQAMTQQYTSVYGQKYEYTTTELFAGVSKTISSGVASYEPSIGGDENPFQTIVQVADKLPLGPVSYGAVEMPLLDAFFPAPCVGYSKITATSIPSTSSTAHPKTRSGIGRQVTEFYTARDFPVYYSHTPFDQGTDKQAHDASTTDFFYKYEFDSRALSQGFLVEINDMHGKMKSQSSYAENDPSLRVNYTENFYRNTGVNGMDDKFDFVSAAKGGVIDPGNVGIDVELMTDTREFRVSSSSEEWQVQVDLFPVLLPFWLPFPWEVTGNSENNYRAVTTTKVVSYHSILDGTLVIDKGSQVSTKNLIYDSETGEVVVSQTNNEFDKPIYNTSYPAWWAYSGMGPAYTNDGVVFSPVNFSDGRIVSGNVDPSLIESGDEIYLISLQSGGGNCPPSAYVPLLWALDKNIFLPGSTTHDYIFVDSAGVPFTHDGATIKIVRSGRRNMLDKKVAAMTSMGNPVVTVDNVRKLSIGDATNVVSASAAEFAQRWQTDNGTIGKFTTAFNQAACTSSEVPDCTGHLEKTINPYKRGLLGNFRNQRSLVFYGLRKQKDPLEIPDISRNGYLDGFTPYWDFDASHHLVPDVSNAKWVWNNHVTRVNSRGLEVETKNALNIYSFAQYGYNRTLPVAIANNARLDEAAYEGFEDNVYKNAISGQAQAICGSQKQIDLSAMSGSSIVKADSIGFNAHTGKYVLAVNPNNSATQAFTIRADPPAYDFTMPFGTDIPKSMVEKGHTFTLHTAAMVPANCLPTNTDFVIFTSNDYNLNLSFTPNDGGAHQGNRLYQFATTYVFYINVTQGGDFPLVLNFAGTDHDENAAVSVSFGNLTTPGLSDQGAGATNCISPNFTDACVGTDYHPSTVHLCKGIYRVELDLQSHMHCNGPSCDGIPASHNVQLSFSFPFVRYKSLTTADGCISTIPVPGNDSMMHPVFAFPKSKPMVLSAWVREDPGTTSSGASWMQDSYSNNSIIVNDGSKNITLKPAGPIIEGWQRYEGQFTPAAAGNPSITFVNNSNKTIYFDDIRLHPFNADMKSYVYDPVNLRLVAELDGNNYATFYEYDEEGTLIRTKAETRQGIKTISETRSAKQKNINEVQ